MGQKPRGVCLDTFLSNAQSRNLAFPKTLLNGKQKVALGKCCRLVETSCNYNQASNASGPLELTRHLVLLKTAALRTCSGEGIAEINFDQNGIPEAKFHGKLVNYPHTLEKKKPHKPQRQTKMLLIPNDCRLFHQKDNEKSNPTGQAGSLREIQRVTVGNSLEKRNPLTLSEGISTVNSIKDSR